jgi:hypothetical protein
MLLARVAPRYQTVLLLSWFQPFCQRHGGAGKKNSQYLGAIHYSLQANKITNKIFLISVHDSFPWNRSLMRHRHRRESPFATSSEPILFCQNFHLEHSSTTFSFYQQKNPIRKPAVSAATILVLVIVNLEDVPDSCSKKWKPGSTQRSSRPPEPSQIFASFCL